MKKPLFSKNILSFCGEMGVKSPEELVGRKIYFSYFSPKEEKDKKRKKPLIIIFQASLISFTFWNLKNKKSEVAIIAPSGDFDFVVGYFLNEKEVALFKSDEQGKEYIHYSPIEEVYVYPDSVK